MEFIAFAIKSLHLINLLVILLLPWHLQETEMCNLSYYRCHHACRARPNVSLPCCTVNRLCSATNKIWLP